MFGNNTVRDDTDVSSDLVKTYEWTAGAIFVSFLSSYVMISMGMPIFGGISYLVLWLLSFGVIWLTLRAKSFLPKLIGLTTFAIVTGVSLSGALMAVGTHVVMLALGATTLDFGTMSLIGIKYQHNFVSWGKQLFAAMIGLIVSELVVYVLCMLHVITMSPMLALTISGISAVLFSAYTIYDSSRLKAMFEQSEEDSKLMALDGALSLFLDFINLFINMLDIVEFFVGGSNNS